MTGMTKDKYLKMAIEYVVDVYKINEEEALSALMSNPEILDLLFGLEVIAHHVLKYGGK